MAAHESEVVYGSLQDDLAKQGVIFTDTDSGDHPDCFVNILNRHPSGDNKFAALNSAVWSGGSFIYVPKGVRLNSAGVLPDQFREHGVLRADPDHVDEGASVHYVEGCSYASSEIQSPKSSSARLRRYTTIQNWSNNVYNLVNSGPATATR